MQNPAGCETRFSQDKRVVGCELKLHVKPAYIRMYVRMYICTVLEIRNKWWSDKYVPGHYHFGSQ